MRKNKIIALLVFLLLAVSGGTLGYYFIENWTLFESLYMTIITLTTTGFMEVRPLSIEGRAFTMILLVLGMGIVVFSISSIMTFVMGIDFKEHRRRKMQEKIDALKDHSIVCGFGRMGKIICSELSDAGHKFVVISKTFPEEENFKHLYITGDASHDEILIKAGIKNASNLITVIDNDHDSLYLTLAARSLNSKLHIMARANQESAESKLKLAGATRVFLPLIMSGHKVAESILNPAVEDILNISGVSERDGQFQLADVYLKSSSPLIGKTLKNCGFTKKEILIVGIRKIDKTFYFAPGGDYEFELGDCLIALGTKENYQYIMSSGIV
ncbi:MAG: potassium channel protein [Epsilonproteobacteria bacterium]|nr:MAG: potassium channel protein [Campylobacterota bacterium]RLA66285.1 MAG: potassium channel protein [Campylobacterota bacterium]